MINLSLNGGKARTVWGELTGLTGIPMQPLVFISFVLLGLSGN